MTDERAKEIVKLVKGGCSFREIGEKFNITSSYANQIYHNYIDRLSRIEKNNKILADSGLKDKLVIYNGKYRYSTDYRLDTRDVGYLQVSDTGYITLYHCTNGSTNKLSRCHRRYPIDDYVLASDELNDYVKEQLSKVVNRATELENKIAKTEKLLEKYKAELQTLREEEING